MFYWIRNNYCMSCSMLILTRVDIIFVDILQLALFLNLIKKNGNHVVKSNYLYSNFVISNFSAQFLCLFLLKGIFTYNL